MCKRVKALRGSKHVAERAPPGVAEEEAEVVGAGRSEMVWCVGRSRGGEGCVDAGV